MVIEIQGVKNGELAVPVNNTLVCHMAFLAADTRPCVLICCGVAINKFYCDSVNYYQQYKFKIKIFQGSHISMRIFLHSTLKLKALVM